MYYKFGHMSPWWYLSRGLYQGNPIGPYLFLLIIETLAIQLRQNPEVEGITVNGVRHLLSQFADDMDMFIKFNREVWNVAMSILSQFEMSSGMLINYDKTTVYRMGSIRNSDAKFYSVKKIQWTNEPLNILGVQVAHDEATMQEINLDPLITKAQNILKVWQMWGLSLNGRIMVVNSLVALLFVYKLSVMTTILTQWFMHM